MSSDTRFRMVPQIYNLQWGKNELEFYKNLAIMFLKYVPAYASGRGAILPDLFHLDQDLRLLISFHPLLLIDSGSNFQMWKQ